MVGMRCDNTYNKISQTHKKKKIKRHKQRQCDKKKNNTFL